MLERGRIAALRALRRQARQREVQAGRASRDSAPLLLRNRGHHVRALDTKGLSLVSSALACPSPLPLPVPSPSPSLALATLARG